MQIPFFTQLKKGQRFLIAGAGGGYDFVHGIPLYLYITETLKKEAILANFSFTQLDKSQSEEIYHGTYKITPDSASLHYFPEKLVSQWFQHQYQQQPPIYAFDYDLGVQKLRHAYNHLIAQHQIDTILLIDGGTDSIIFGDEKGLGTIVEDANSMVAVAGSNAPHKYIAAIGFGCDHFHGVNHYNFLENVATLIKDKGYLGAFSLTESMPEGAAYLSMTNYLNQHNPNASIVNNSIAGAMEGEFGNVHRTNRTEEDELFINPLMPLYWTFTLQSVVNRMIFAPALEKCETIKDVIYQIRMHKLDLRNFSRHRQAIPL